MREQFLVTDHGLVNARFIVHLVQLKIGGYQGDWDVHFSANDGQETRQAKATDDAVKEFLDGPSMPA